MITKYLPKFKVVEVNNLTGLRNGHMLSQFAADESLATTVNGNKFIENGVIVTPCVAMVEQFIKDGKFNNRITAHNGKYKDGRSDNNVKKTDRRRRVKRKIIRAWGRF